MNKFLILLLAGTLLYVTGCSCDPAAVGGPKPPCKTDDSSCHPSDKGNGDNAVVAGANHGGAVQDAKNIKALDGGAPVAASGSPSAGRTAHSGNSGGGAATAATRQGNGPGAPKNAVTTSGGGGGNGNGGHNPNDAAGLGGGAATEGGILGGGSGGTGGGGAATADKAPVKAAAVAAVGEFGSSGSGGDGSRPEGRGGGGGGGTGMGAAAGGNASDFGINNAGPQTIFEIVNGHYATHMDEMTEK